MNYIKLKNWTYFDHTIIGDIHGHGDWEDGKTIRTSPLVSLDGDLVTTRSGSIYQLCNSYTYTLSKLKEKMTDTEGKHRKMVLSLVKSGEDTYKDLDPHASLLIHMAMGISGESGELLDAIKKHTIYTKTLDRENVVEELGDLEFYMEGLRAALHITREETLQYNINKLGRRYSDGYSNEAAVLRADKSE